jgi:hypothetical protein
LLNAISDTPLLRDNWDCVHPNKRRAGLICWMDINADLPSSPSASVDVRVGGINCFNPHTPPIGHFDWVILGGFV